jgi:outer membrane autotransporter protein
MPRRTVQPLVQTAATASLAFMLCTVSHQALACSGNASTAGTDTVVCDAANPGAGDVISTDGGNDSVSVSVGTTGTIGLGADNDAVLVEGGTTARITGNSGNDVLVVTGGNLTNGLRGDISNSNAASGKDLLLVFGASTVITGEVQGNHDTDTIAIFGGTTGNVETGDGVGDRVFLDGGTVSGVEVNAGATGHTIYLRNGTITGNEAVESEGNTADTFVIDPVNSKVASDFASVDSISAFDAALLTAATNTSAFLTIKGTEFETDDADDDAADTVTFIGAVNAGTDHDNLLFSNPAGLGFNGGDKADAVADDTMNVLDHSNLVLGEIENFEFLNVKNNSILTLTEEDEEGPPAEDAYTFGKAVTVDGTSVLSFTAEEVTLVTDKFRLESGDGIEERLDGLPDYYATFETGGILQIGDAAEEGSPDPDPGEAAEQTKLEIHLTGDTPFLNNGTISMLNGTVGGTIEIEGNYDARRETASDHAGNLALDTELGDSESETDTFKVEGQVHGTTTVYVNNAGGRGAFTGRGEDDGIEIVEVEGAAGTLEPDAFKLGINAWTGLREVIAGPFSYRLFSFVDDGGDEGSFRLQSDILDEVPAYAAATSVAQKFAAAGIDTLYKRLGEVRLGYEGTDKEFAGGSGSMWVRGLYADFDVDPRTGWDFSQRNDGVLIGADARVNDEDGGRWLLGLFGGYGTAEADVDAVIWDAPSRSHVDLTAWSFGAYATFYERDRPGQGLYVDAVAKGDILDFDMSSDNRGNAGSTDGYAASVSGETGYGLGLGGGVVLQPQAQLSFTTVSQTNFTGVAAYALDVGTTPAESLIGRAGLQLQGNYQMGGGWVTPYAIVNVLTDFLGNNETLVAGTSFENDIGLTWYSAGGGITAELSKTLALYGSGEYLFGDVEGWSGTGGIKARW